MGGGEAYAEQLRSKIIAGPHWRDTSEARRVIRQLMIQSRRVLPTPSPTEFEERERVLREAGRPLSRVAWDRQVFAIRDLIADGNAPHMGRITRWAIHAIAVAVKRSEGES